MSIFQPLFSCKKSRDFFIISFSYILSSFAYYCLFDCGFHQHWVWINHIIVDISSWWQGMQPLVKGKIPYVDFSREYPVGAGLCYWGLWKLFLFKDFSEFLYTHVIFILFLNYFVVLGVYFVLEKINSSRSLLYSLFYLLFPVAFFVGPTRFEPVVMLFVIWGYYFYLKDKSFISNALWSLGCVVKWYPIIFIGINEWRYLFTGGEKTVSDVFKRWSKTGVSLFFILAFFNAPFIIMGYKYHGSASVWLDTYLFHVNRPLYWDTALGAMELWWGTIPWERSVSFWSLCAMIGVFLWKPSMPLELKSLVVLMMAFVFNRVYSVQFNMWFIPMAFFAAAFQKNGLKAMKLLFLVFMLDIITVIIYPVLFGPVLSEIVGFSPGCAYRYAHLVPAPYTFLFTGLLLLRPFFMLYIIWWIFYRFYEPAIKFVFKFRSPILGTCELPGPLFSLSIESVK